MVQLLVSMGVSMYLLLGIQQHKLDQYHMC
jgi:hypothetical protein